MKLLFLLCTLVTLLSSPYANATPAEDLPTVGKRLAASFAQTAASASEVGVDDLLDTLDTKGHWPDLEAKYPAEDLAYIRRYVHFLRVWKLAGTWQTTTAGPLRTQLAAAIHRALGFWLYQPTPGSIPWFVEIGAPQALGRAAVIFDAELTADERRATVAIMRNCVRPDGVLDYCGSPATGQNLQHEAEIQVLVGCLLREPALLTRYLGELEHEIGVRDAEGLKVDWSFHQHGPQLYSGGLYGNAFSRDGAKIAAALHGTAFAFAPETIAALVHYVLDGQRWMTRGRSFDFLTVGRTLVWPDFQVAEPERDLGAAEAAETLAELDPVHRDELLAFAARKHGKQPPDSAPVGIRVFWASDYVAHQRPGFFASARMSSRRVYGQESGNRQNELGYHLGDGAMTLMVTGEEYHDIFPLWDWWRVPGVTCVYTPGVPFPLHTWGKGSQGWSDFAGGVSDGTVGAAAMELRRGGLHAQKAWFFLEDAVVCLGTDIQPDNAALPVVTSIDQRWAGGPVRSSTAGTPLPPEVTHNQTGPGWVHHAGVSYLFPQGGEVRVRTEHKSAPWSVVNQSAHGSMFRTGPLSELVASGDVFSLWIEHGTGLFTPTTYQYLVAPGLEPEDIPAFEKTAPGVLSNTASLQAIAREGLVQAVFWQAGEVKLPDGRRLTVDRPCMVQLRREPKNKAWTLAVGNPTHMPGPLHVGLAAAQAEQAPTDLAFDFPAGPYLGQPQVRPLP